MLALFPVSGSAFPGTVLLVSHDRYLIDAVAEWIWAIEGDRITVSQGNYTTYREAQLAAARPKPAAATAAGANAAPPATRPGKGEKAAKSAAAKPSRSASTEARRVAELEQAIERQEAALRAMEDDLAAASASGDVTRVANLGRTYVDQRARLDELYAVWEAEATHA